LTGFSGDIRMATVDNHFCRSLRHEGLSSKNSKKNYIYPRIFLFLLPSDTIIGV